MTVQSQSKQGEHAAYSVRRQGSGYRSWIWRGCCWTCGWHGPDRDEEVAATKDVEIHRGTRYFCDYFIEIGDDPWAGTYCKLRAGHDGPCSPLYWDEAKQGEGHA